MRVRLEFKPQDLWIGAYWKTTPVSLDGGHRWRTGIDLWICLLPTVPVHLSWIGHDERSFP